MKDEGIPKKALTYKPKRWRNIGRPQLRSKDQHTPREDGTDYAYLIHDYYYYLNP
jgi:hypothetical protein